MATDDTSSGSSGNEAGDENELKGSDNENDENEGEVTEAQKKVAEAAGLADQVFFLSFRTSCCRYLLDQPIRNIPFKVKSYEEYRI